MQFRIHSAAVVLLLAVVSPAVAGRTWTDNSGSFRVEAELVTVKNDKVYLEKVDGSVIAVPLDRLSDADREYIRSLEEKKTTPATAPAPTSPFDTPPVALPPAVSKPQTAPLPPSNTPAGVDSQALAQRVRAIFEANCYRCHGQDGANEGGFNFVMNLEKVATTYVEPRDPANSFLLERVAAGDEDSAMPPPGEEPRPSADDIAAIRQWIAAGAPALAAAKQREFISNDQILKFILADLRAAPERARRFHRYFTLTHLYNVGISEDELQTYRHAFAKLVNSLSWSSSLATPQPVDPAATVLRIDIRQLNWTDENWEQIVAANPYGLQFTSTDAKACYEAAESEMPLVRADWFVFAAARPPLYHSILGIPETDLELERLLRVNVADNIRQEKVARAAFNRSGVSQNNRLIERHELPYGGFWKSYDFGGNIGRQNLFEYPLGPDTDTIESFQHDGGEIIFSLPNGLQGYMLVDASGKRIDKGPTNIVSDPQRADRAVLNGLSCVSCHYAGSIPKADEIRPFVEVNRNAFDDPETILALYQPQEVLDKHFQDDGRRFVAALEKIGIKKISRSGEPVSTMALRFEQELDLALAAAEFGLKPEELAARLVRSDSLARSLGALRTPGGTIKRDAFVEVFPVAAEMFGLTGSSRGRLATRPTTLIPVDDDDRVGEVRRFPDMGWGVKSLAFSPDGGRLAVGKTDRALLLFDVNSSQRLSFHDNLEALGQVTCVAFTPDGKKLLTGGWKGEILIWEVGSSGNLTRSGQFVGHTEEIDSIAISRDSRFALSGGKDKRARYWQIDSRREIHSVPGFAEAVKACHISRDGRLGLACDGKALLHIDLSGGKPLRTVKLDATAPQAVAISPAGDRVICGDHYALRMWDTNTGNELPRFQDREIQWTAVFTPDGKRICTGASSKVNVWDVATQRRIATLEVGHSYVQAIACAPDNRHIAAIPGSAGQDLQVLRLPKPDR